MTEEIVVDIVCEGERLVGILHAGSSEARIGVVIVVGGGQYRVGAHRQFVRLARAFAREGMPVLRFDVRGMGDSDGETRHFLALEDDIEAAVDALYARVDTLDGVVLWGLCDGASASMLYAPKDRRVVGVALVNPWVSTEEGVARTYLRHYYTARFRDPGFWREVVRGQVAIGPSLRSFAETVGRLGRTSTRDADENAASEEPTLPDAVFGALGEFAGEILIVISRADLTAREFQDELSRRGCSRHEREHPLTIVSLEADHTFTTSTAHRELCETTRRWLSHVAGG